MAEPASRSLKEKSRKEQSPLKKIQSDLIFILGHLNSYLSTAPSTWAALADEKAGIEGLWRPHQGAQRG